jgi:hypothetical protein
MVFLMAQLAIDGFHGLPRRASAVAEIELESVTMRPSIWA